ncbi:MAG: rRNA maturation RNase YbeY [Candidatus Margulisbacteria bacterium]|jgi:probable rRNA maturation factor|nr:rRNA maturation RNase YbeY [Candidatus Margulisiibacteriota bacterium]
MLYLNQLVRVRADLAFLRRAAAELCRKTGRRGDLSITFCSARQIQRLNQKFRRDNKPTDVLSFDSGDIVIAPAVARSNARKYRQTLTAELLYLIIHGLCHLRGHDHSGPADTARMRRAENRLLAYTRKKYNIQLTGRINALS